MRIGVFGGTFDPVHLAHLILAEQCREQGRLDEVRFMVAARPPHKPQPVASFDQRVEMLTLAISGQPAFRVEELERDRPAYNYMVHTSPFDTRDLSHYHWHIEIIPRLTRVAGFEWGTGFYINQVAPEEAAAFLREAEVDPTGPRK